MDSRKHILSKAYLGFFVLCFVALGILGRILYIQLIEGAKWQQRVERITTDLREITPARGNIYADNGTILSTSVPIYELRMDMRSSAYLQQHFHENIDSLSRGLSLIFRDRSPQEYKSRLLEAYHSGARYYLVKGGVEFDVMERAARLPLWNKGRLRGGLIIEKKIVRKTPYPDLAKRTIGYKREGGNLVGLEAAYDIDLSGKPGKRYEKRLAGGDWMPVSMSNMVDPVDGCDIYSTIDVQIQDAASAALRRELINHGAHHGCAVVMEVKTGYVKAIANLGIGPNGLYDEIDNYAVKESTEPGSTFKLASFMAAFEDGLLELTDTVDTKNGTTKFFDQTMRDSNNKGYGVVDVRTAFLKSSNVATSVLIHDRYSKNPRAFTDRLLKMGLGRPLGLDLQPEGLPLIKDPSDPSWSGVTLPWMSIGYETLMTPMQTLTFYNAVANDGVMVKPIFVKEIKRNGKTVRSIQPQVIHPAIASRETIRKARILLESVVTEEGTAYNLRHGPYRIAGKTGTAQIANQKYGYKYAEKVSYQASFVGYFPADAPEYTCIVVVNGPSRAVYNGNQVAGPVFKEIADKIIAQRIDLYNDAPEEPVRLAVQVPVSKSGKAGDLNLIFSHLKVPMVDESEGADYVSTRSMTNEVRAEKRSVYEGRVPNVVGMGLRDGLHLLEAAGFKVKVSGAGMIVRQSLPPGIEAETGKTITIELS